MSLAGAHYLVHLVIREAPDGHRFYDHVVLEAVKPPGSTEADVGAQVKPPSALREGGITVSEARAQFKGTGFLKALGKGERWITVKAPGHDKGQPLLIRDQPDGSAKVIGGAGGSMNHLRLTGVRKAEDYKAEAASRDATRREAKKRQAEQDKKDGLTASKSKAREAIRAQVGQHETAFVKTVPDALGWTPEQMRFPEEKFQNASEPAKAAAAQNHARELFTRAQEAVDQQRKTLVQDSEMRAEAGLGEVPMTTSSPEAISVQDLSPIAEAGAGLGFAPQYGKRAARAGLTDRELATEAAASRPAKAPTPDGEPTPDERRKAVAKQVAGELKTIREPGP